jgi:hypothetical protein
MSPRRRVRGRRLPSVVAVLAAAAGLLTLTPIPASAAVPTAPVTLPLAIEVMPPYQPQVYCDPVAKPGITAFATLLTATYAGTTVVSTVRSCGSDTSEHYDGRAIDWGVNVANDRQRAQGKALLQWLFAADAAGNRYAMLRRLGVMYIIWNSRIWGTWSQSWEPYSCSGVTACHKDHMHLSFDWSGAEKKTSFWTGTVSDPMPPPLLSLRALHRPQTVTVEARDPDPDPIYRLVAGGRYRFIVTGVYHYGDRRRHKADAECSTRDGTTWVKQPPDAPAGIYDLSAIGSSRWRAVGESTGGCSSTHTYRRTVTVERRTPLALVIDNPDRWAGYGELRLTVERTG